MNNNIDIDIDNNFEILDNYIQTIAAKHGIDLSKLSDNIPQFCFLLECINYKFDVNNFIKDKHNNINSINNSYDVNNIFIYTDIFLKLCHKYNINTNLSLYCLFVNITYDSVYRCLNNNMFNNISLESLKKLQGSYKTINELQVANSNQVVGKIAILNKYDNASQNTSDNRTQALPDFSNFAQIETTKDK